MSEHGTYQFPPPGWDLAGSETGQGPTELYPWQPPEGKSTWDWCQEPDEEHVHILGPMLSERDRLIVGGASGHGKTTFVMQMIAAIATGGSFLGMPGCGGRVMVIDLEQGKRTMKRRMREAGLHETRNVMYYRAPDGMDLNDPRQIAWLAESIEHQLTQGDPYRVLVLDPLYKMHAGDSSDERAMVDLMRRIDVLRDRFGFALIIPMHLRKSAGQDKAPQMADLFGSSGVVWGAEMAVCIWKMGPGMSKLYFFKDREGDLSDYAENLEHWTLWFDRENGYRRGPDAVREKMTATQRILTAVAGGNAPFMSRKRMSELTKMALPTVEKAVKQLVDEGALEEHPQLAPDGTKLFGLPRQSVIIQRDGIITGVDAIADLIEEAEP